MNSRSAAIEQENVSQNLCAASFSAVAWRSRIISTYLGTKWLKCSKSIGSRGSGWKPEESFSSKESNSQMTKTRKTSIWTKMMMERTFWKTSTMAQRMSGSGTLFVRRIRFRSCGVSSPTHSQYMLFSPPHSCLFSKNSLKTSDNLKCLSMFASLWILLWTFSGLVLIRRSLSLSSIGWITSKVSSSSIVLLPFLDWLLQKLQESMLLSLLVSSIGIDSLTRLICCRRRF